jgi:hypothetical protein
LRDLAALLSCRLDLRERGANRDEKRHAHECACERLPDRCLLHGCTSIFAYCLPCGTTELPGLRAGSRGGGSEKPSGYSGWPCSIMQERYV